MARDDPTIYMRLPADIKERLDRAAAENRRSLTAEVTARLQESFEPTPSAGLSRSQRALLRLVVSFAQGPFSAAQLGGSEEQVEKNRFLEQWLVGIRDDPSFDAEVHLEKFSDFAAKAFSPTEARPGAPHPREWLVDQLLAEPGPSTPLK